MKTQSPIHLEEKAFLFQKILSRMIQYYQKHPLPNLLIFSGPNKILKHYVVLHKIAFYHLCINQNHCKECKACLLLEKQEHPDLIIFPDDKIKIGDVKDPEPFSIRWLQKNILVYKPAVSPIRIVLFPAAEKLGLEAEIALLKTLEEPSPYTKFIFFTPSLDQLKDTIISRGVNIPLKNFSLEQMHKITEINDYEFLEILGGSLDNFYSIKYEFYQTLKQKILQALEHPIDLIELEDWSMQNSKIELENEGLQENQFWELFVHVFLQCIRRSVLYTTLAPKFMDFLIGLRAEQPGLLPYLTSRLFYELFYHIYLKTT
jgi:DNA polymerase III delta prime subunit